MVADPKGPYILHSDALGLVTAERERCINVIQAEMKDSLYRRMGDIYNLLKCGDSHADSES